MVLVDLEVGLMAAAPLLEGEVAKSRGAPPQLPRTPPQRGQGQVQRSRGGGCSLIECHEARLGGAGPEARTLCVMH